MWSIIIKKPSTIKTTSARQLKFFYHFSAFISYFKIIVFLKFTCKATSFFFHFASKFIVVNQLKSGVVIKACVSGVLLWISVVFVLTTSLATRLLMSDNWIQSTSACLVFRLVFVARLVISGILFSISAVFVFCTAAVANPAK